ncbi:hypothetical protein HY388_01100 [Candidatus Daviesbacteria bacterium]|nr:hypothetical protein [Candidatus Daviesbacteria bacterium]
MLTLFSKIKSLLPNRPSPQVHYLLAVVIGKTEIEVGVWYLSSAGVEIIAVAAQPIEQGLSLEEIIAQATDQAEIRARLQASHVVFGLPQDWFVQDKISPTKLDELKQASQHLDLIPIAYVSCPHALVHLIKTQEKTPPSAILLGWDGDLLTINISRTGRIEFSQDVPYYHNLEETLKNTLFSISRSIPGAVPLPARIILWGKSWSGEDRELLTSAGWLSQLPFLHLPRVEILPGDSRLKAVALAGGVDQAQELQLPNLPLSVRIKEESVKIVSSPEKQSVGSEMPEEDNFGFVVDFDIAKTITQETPLVAVPANKVAFKNSDNLGFSPPPKISNKLFGWSQIALPNINWPSVAFPSHLSRLAVFAGAAIVLVGGIIFGLVWLIPSARVVVYGEEKVIQKEAEVIADPSSPSLNVEIKVIPAAVLEVGHEGSAKGVVEGTKTIGDKSRGEVVIYNKTTTKKTFSTGAAIISVQGLKFLLESDVTVASQSATTNEQTQAITLTPGTAKVAVIAEKIGSDYNLAASPDKSNFTIAGFAEGQFNARNFQAFAGGSSREIRMVTENDQKNLTEQLAKQLTSQVKEKLILQVPADKQLLEQAIRQEVTKKVFDKKIGDEARELTLTMNVIAKATIYSENDLKELLTRYVTALVPENYQQLEMFTTTEAQVTKVDNNGKLFFTGKLNAILLPKMPTSEIAQSLAGKSINDAQEYLKTLANSVGFQVQISPSWLKFLPDPLKTMPRNPQRISVEVTHKN